MACRPFACMAAPALRFAIGVFAALAFAFPGRAEPVTFAFRLDRTVDRSAELAREIFAEVVTPSGETIRLPAFPDGRGEWIVRARADQAGEYRLGAVIERVNGEDRPRHPGGKGRRMRLVSEPTSRLSVQRDPQDALRFAFSDGSPFVPLGANLAWTPGAPVAWHLDAFRAFEANHLNWTRIWMCHWGATNLDWLPENMGRSPRPGRIDARIAENWDKILAGAEKHGVYVQLVLQHHGQYTTGANSNWTLNPWNAANRGGFLKNPADFFTSRRAIELTKQKYRTIVARWAHSPAILAWELFNEVHWTNGYTENEAAVAAWHREMADYLRSIDPYRHLVTTSLDDLRSPIYAAMDYFQPHLYAINMLTGVREFELPVTGLDRPVFWGEIGDDKMPVTQSAKAAGSQLVPQVWASLMGAGPLPGQSWLGEVFLRTGRLGELGAVSRFLAASGLAVRRDLLPFSPGVESEEAMPLQLIPGYDWARHRPSHATIPLDGSDSPEANQIPGILVGDPESVAEGYLDAFTLDLDIPRPTHATCVFADGASRGATIEVVVDGKVVGSHVWPALPNARKGQKHDAPARPATITVSLPSGARRLTLRNTGGEDWVQLERIALDLPTPMIAAAGKRGADFIALWAWNKRGVHALEPSDDARARLVIPDVAPGEWTVTWWDADRGVPGATTGLTHPGGTVLLETPRIARHAAVMLIRKEGRP